MPDQPVRSEAFKLADALYTEAQVVASFIDEKIRIPVDERVAATPHGVVFQVQLHRAIAWLRSLAKLNAPADFQAVAAGARALFEVAVDVALMHFDPVLIAPIRWMRGRTPRS